MKTLLWTLLFVLGTATALAGGPMTAEPTITGHWLTENGDGTIEVYVTPDGTLEGKIIDGKGKGRLDDKNPEPALRTRPLKGVVILKGMKPDGPGRWSGGTIYDPDSGNTYRCTVRLEGKDVLHLRGYVGVSLFGRTSRWTRLPS